ncbi:MAG: GH116 family glycosyl hydrolase, partial [Armatimonadota bacterium]
KQPVPGTGEERAPTWRNYYAELWKDAWDVASYVGRDLDRLHAETKLFRDTLFASTVPTHVLDAVSSQVSILKTPTCLRLPGGVFYGFEGCSNNVGCCEGSCTHVWNYAQALPYLFPSLQRSMLEAHYANCLEDDGYMTFRMPLPLGTKAEPRFHPAADGQMGTVMQVYREWLISGDDAWLRARWPQARRALEFAWKYWDADKDGVMEGMQHNTYDIEFYGPNTMSGSLYLGALRAAEEMARHLGEDDKADEYHALCERGSAWTDENLWNGGYYEQQVNPTAHEAWPEPQRSRADRHGKDDKFPDWPKWQYGKGCISDQLIGQWYAEMLGLGYLYKRGNVRRTLQSIFNCNWRPDLTTHPCLLRIYAQNDEAGLLIGAWPRGERPGYAFYFSDEVWCGIEYQVASHLIYEGFVREGLAIVKGARDRYTGERRNPWNEIECGHHYSRSMASYAVLTALSGFSYSAPEQRMGFAPRLSERDFKVFFSVGSGWGEYAQKAGRGSAELSVAVKYGSLTLAELSTNVSLRGKKSVAATIGLRRVAAEMTARRDGTVVTFEEPVTIERGETLKVKIQ